MPFSFFFLFDASSASTAFFHRLNALYWRDEEITNALRRENERTRAKVVVVVMFLARGGSVAKRRSSRDAVVSVARAVRFSFRKKFPRLFVAERVTIIVFAE